VKAIVVVDLQKDLIDGPFSIEGANNIILPINAEIKKYETVVAVQDFHPQNHKCFLNKEQRQHCVQFSDGANFPDIFDSQNVIKVFYRGQHPTADGYSAFFDFDREYSTYLHEWMQGKGVKEVSFVGLSIEETIRNSAIDAISLGYKASVLLKCCRGRDNNLIEKAIEDMKKSGVAIID